MPSKSKVEENNLTVIAWGLGLERPTMIYYGLDKIRDLFGHEVSLTSVKENIACYMKPVD